MKKCQIGNLFFLLMLCNVPSGYSHAQEWINFGATPGIPMTITSATTMTVSTTRVRTFNTTDCTGSTATNNAFTGDGFSMAAGTHTYYLSTKGILSTWACPTGTTSRSINVNSLLRLPNVACSPVGGCATVTCLATGVIGTVTASTLAATCT